MGLRIMILEEKVVKEIEEIFVDDFLDYSD